MRERRSGHLATLIMAAIVLAACAAPSATTSSSSSSPTNAEAPRVAAPSRVVVAINGVPKTLSEKLNSAGGGNVSGVTSLSGLLNAGMARYDSRGNLQPQLAEAVPAIENGLWAV